MKAKEIPGFGILTSLRIITHSRNFAQKIQRADIGLKSKVQAVVYGFLIENKRQFFWGAAKSGINRTEGSNQAR